MKKRLGILALAATLIVQSAAFVPTFAEDTAAEPTAAEETVLARYESKDGVNMWNCWTSPWAPYAQLWSNGWKRLGDGEVIGYNGDTQKNYKGLRNNVWFGTAIGGPAPDGWKIAIVPEDETAITNGRTPWLSKAVMSAGSYTNMHRLAKGFTAPEGGIIKIGSDYDWNKEGDDNIIAGVGVDHGAYITITSSKGNTVLEQTEMKKNSGLANMAEIDIIDDGKPTVRLEYTYSSYYRIEKGETLYFTVGNPDGNVLDWASFVSWNPIVEYLAYQPEYSEITYDRNGASFKVTNDPGITADDIWVFYGDEEERVTNFSNKDGYITFDFINKLKGGISYDIVIDKSVVVSGVNMAVGNNYEGLTVDAANNTFSSYRKETSWDNDSIWAAYWRTWDDQMQLMTSGINGNDANGDHNYDDAVPALGIHGNDTWLGHMKTADKTAWDNNVYVPFVGPTLMSAGGGYPWDAGYYAGYTVAKGFTAPYSGNVRIEQNNIVAKTTNNNGESVIDTTKKNEIWSNASGDNSGVNLRIAKNKINAGDDRSSVIWGDAQLNGANNGTYVFEPITVYVNKGDILYFAIEPVNRNWSTNDETLVHWNPVVTYTDVAINAAFIDGSGNTLTTVENLLAADGVQLKMSAFDTAEDVAGTPIIVFCDENGALVKTVIGNTVNLEAVLGNTTVQLGNLTGVNAKSVKVMLWSADGTLKPLTGVFGELN